MAWPPCALVVHFAEAVTITCPHFDIGRNYCLRLGADCLPGRPGCVLAKNSTFAVPVAERLSGSPTRRRNASSRLKNKGARRPGSA